MQNDLLAYIFIYASGASSPVANIQYTYYDDGVIYFREGTRGGYHVIDQAITPLGFDGVENTDWKYIERDKLGT